MTVITEMIAKAGSLLRPNRFKCRINFPIVVDADEASKDSELWCETATIPSSEMGVIEIPVEGGHTVKIAGDPTYPEFSCTFLASSDQKIFRALKRWQEIMSSAITGTRANDLAYFGSITLEQLDGIGNVVQTTELIGCFPITVSEISLSKETKDDVTRFDASFAYQYPVTNLV